MNIPRDELAAAVRALCADFGNDYWQAADDKRAYPHEFVDALTEAGYLACLIPEEYGGMGLGVREACVILEEINRSGANSGACHAQMYTMGTLLRHGSDAQKRRWLPGSRRANCACRPSRSPSRMPGPTPRAYVPSRSAGATRTWFGDRRSSSRACASPT